MTGFDGPVIAYSWPSQHKVLSYAVDKTNMYHDVRNFRDFLKALAEQSWVSEVVIVAHSPGARLVVPAVAYVDRPAAGSDRRNIRSEERRGGQEGVSTCRSGWSPGNEKKKEN